MCRSIRYRALFVMGLASQSLGQTLTIGGGAIQARITRISSFVFEDEFTNCLNNTAIPLNTSEDAVVSAIIVHNSGVNVSTVQVLFENVNGTPLSSFIVVVADPGTDCSMTDPYGAGAAECRVAGLVSLDEFGDGMLVGNVSGSTTGKTVLIYQEIQPFNDDPDLPPICPLALIATGCMEEPCE